MRVYLSKACCFTHWAARRAVTINLFVSAVFLIAVSITSADALAQRRFDKTYPAHKNVRLRLTNWSGSIMVEGWERNDIKVVADMESSAACCTPESSADGLVIDVVRDNHRRSDVGDVNFQVHVPVNSTVDLETKSGNITVRGVQGRMVRAEVSAEGNIELTGVRATAVMASNTTGDILFDGEVLADGKYVFTSMQGSINIRVPADSEFSLTAAAPMTRTIDLGSFATRGLFNSFSGNRKIVGKVGDGRASFTVTNHRGSIMFIRRHAVK